MTRLESRQRGLFAVVAESARWKPASASEASAHSELVAGFLVHQVLAVHVPTCARSSQLEDDFHVGPSK